jgi:glutamate-5-semialdehyde dehydrogenase
VEKAEIKLEKEEYEEVLVDRLRLEKKMDSIKEMVESIENQEKVVGKTQEARKLDENLELYKVSTPLGVIGTIFESRPDAMVQIASLCMKSGNSVILKGGSEAKNSNTKIFKVIDKATDVDGWIQLAETHEEVDKLLDLEEVIDLVIPRGGKSLVKHVQENTNIEVMGHAEGLCHVYIDSEADIQQAIEVAIDAKTDYPAACNAVETLLIHEDIKDCISNLLNELQRKEVEIIAEEELAEEFGLQEASEKEWSREYNSLKVSIKTVETIQEAIKHINQHGSGHTDSIITENKSKAHSFLQKIDSSSIMWNASTRFADGFRYGLGAEVGISTGKTHARGPVGIQGLTTYNYLIKGNGQKTSNYNEEDYLHKEIGRQNPFQ